MTVERSTSRVDSPIDPSCRSLVVVCPSWVGDTVMATPVLRALRQHRPEMRSTGIMRPGLSEVLAGCPWLDAMIEVNNRGLFGPSRAARAIRQTGADVAMLLPNSFRSALSVRLSHIGRRIGYARDGRTRLLTHSIRPQAGGPIAMIEYYRRLGEFALGIDSIDPSVEIFLTDEQQRAAARLLEDVNDRFIVLNPGANKRAKRWPAERFAQAAASIAQRFDCDVAVSGAPSEATLVEEVVDAGRAHGIDFTNLINRGIGLGSLKGVLQRAALLITNDTGPRHLALALATPVTSLFGPTDYRWTTVPSGREHIVLAEPFLPHRLIADDYPGQCAIDRIAVSDVVHAASHLLSDPTVKEVGTSAQEADQSVTEAETC